MNACLNDCPIGIEDELISCEIEMATQRRIHAFGFGSCWPDAGGREHGP